VDSLSALFSGVGSHIKGGEELSLYRLLLLDLLDNHRLNNAKRETLTCLRIVLGLGDEDAESAYQAVAVPLYRKVVDSAVDAGELGASEKAKVEAELIHLDLSESLRSAVALEVYGTRLRAQVTDGSIISEEQAAHLEALRVFLGINVEGIHPVHEEVYADSYRDSVREVMGTTGIIPDEYWDGLETLRARLSLSEGSAQKLFEIEVTAKMKVIGTKAMDALEQKARAQQTGDREGPGKLGIAESALAMHVLDLVDFAMASKTFVDKEVDGLVVETVGADLRGEFELASLKALYRQYLVDSFSGMKPEDNQRLLNSLDKVSLVLGLKAQEVRPIHDEIGTTIFRQYLSKALDQGPVTEQGRQFLVQIRQTLSMDQGRCDEIVRDCEVGHVSVLIETMFEKSSVVPVDVRRLRAAMDTFDVDLEADLSLSVFKLERLFLCELEDLVETDSLKSGEFGPIEELCEAFHVTESRASAILEQTVQKRASAGVLQAASLLRQAEHNAAVSELERVLKFAALLDVNVDAPAVSSRERTELYLLYQASSLTSEPSKEAVTAHLELLKSVLGLAEQEPASA